MDVYGGRKQSLRKKVSSENEKARQAAREEKEIHIELRAAVATLGQEQWICLQHYKEKPVLPNWQLASPVANSTQVIFTYWFCPLI